MDVIDTATGAVLCQQESCRTLAQTLLQSGITNPSQGQVTCPEPVCFDRSTTACRVTSTMTTSETAYAACFNHHPASKEEPLLAERVPMTELRSGDRVLSHTDGTKMIDHVLFNQHVKATRSHTPMLRLVLEEGDSELRVTPDHVIMVDGKWQPARMAVAGSSLTNADGKFVRVRSVSLVTGGVINPVTASGTILAAGKEGSPFLASTYGEWIADRVLPRTAHSFLSEVLITAYPQATQDFYDSLIEPMFPDTDASWRYLLEVILEWTPNFWFKMVFALGDLAVSFCFLCFALLTYVGGIGTAVLGLALALVCCRACTAPKRKVH